MLDQVPRNFGSPGAPTTCHGSEGVSALAMRAGPAVLAVWAEGTVPSVEALICAPVSEPGAIFLAVTAPSAILASVIAPFLTFTAVTAFFLSCLVPTLF